MKKILTLFFICIIIFSLAIFFIPWIIDNKNFKKNIYYERDKHNLNLVENIKNDIDNNIEFNWLNDFNEKFNKEYFPAKKCIYLKSINDWNGFIISFLLESDKFIKDFWTNEYLFISNSDYLISKNEKLLILSTINDFCK